MGPEVHVNGVKKAFRFVNTILPSRAHTATRD